jgi:hypothetical protein
LRTWPLKGTDTAAILNGRTAQNPDATNAKEPWARPNTKACAIPQPEFSIQRIILLKFF